MSRRLLRALGLGAIVGLGLGLYYGWIVRPSVQVSGQVQALRQDYKDDYLLMIAEAYSADGDLARAQARLDAAGFSDPGPAVAALAERFISGGRESADIRRLAALAGALGHTTPAIAPYLEGTEGNGGNEGTI
jgi:hypothetical protein